MSKRPLPRTLRDAELLFRLLVESVEDYAIFMLDPAGHILTWNTGAERIKGYGRDEIVGLHFSRFYPPEAVARGWPQEELERATAAGRFEDEGWRVRKDGSRFWANVVITAMHDEAGKLIGFGKVTRDLTERRNAEEVLRRAHGELEQRVRERTTELQAERQRLHVTLTSIGDGAITTDASGRVTFLNPVAETLTGWAAADAVGHRLEDVFHIIDEHTRKRIDNPVQKVLATGSIIGLASHTVLISKAGSERPIDDGAAPIKDEDGPILGVVMIFRDVTERRRAEELQLRLSAIVESSDDAIIGKTLEGIVTSWNKGAERLYDYRADEILGKPISVLLPPEQADEFPAIMERLRRGETIAHYETVRVRRDGTRVDVSLVISPIKTPDGHLMGASAIARDISGRKETERRLRQSNEELREADRRKNQFLAMLAHELRNPLAPVRNALHILQLPSATIAHRDTARGIMERQVQHLTRLVDDLLDVSRVMQDRIELRRERADLRTVVERAVETVQPMITARDQTLSITLPSDTITLDVDVVRVAQAISNLLVNAAKFTEVGGKILLSAERSDDEVVLHVGDTGIGIAPEFLPQVFELFAQADRSLDRSQGGLGIGLTLVRKLIQLHGGTVQAFSAGIGKGSEFIVRLPVTPAEPDTARRRHAGAAAATRQARKVLVVDDNMDSAESTAMLLRLAGHQVRVAYDGPAALEHVGAFHPDVVLLDIGLPGIDGYELARSIRARADHQSVVLVAITGYGRPEDRQRSRAAGFDHHLTKPFDPKTLEALVASQESATTAPEAV